MRLILFDLEGTILENKSAGTAFSWYLFKKGKFGIKQTFYSLWFLCRWIFKFKTEVFIKDKAYFTGLSEDEIFVLGAQFVKDYLLQRVRPFIKERIEAHHQASDIVILLTGAPNFIANEIASRLGIHEVVASEYNTKNGFFTALPPNQHLFKREKLTAAKKLCDKYHVELFDCVAYGNSFNDRFLLEAVHVAIAVTPDRRLRRLAKKQHWEILDTAL